MLLDVLAADSPARHGNDDDDDDDDDGNKAHAHAHAHAHHGAFSLAQMPLSLLGSVLRYQTHSPPTQHAHPDGAPASPVPASDLASSPSSAALPTSPAASRPGSAGSSAVDGRARKRKTSYLIAHPPPAVHHARSKLHMRPKVQLQLHQLQPQARPKPVFEVVPASLLGPRATRRLARRFNTRARLCHSDLLVVAAAAYAPADDPHQSDDDRWAARELVAAICPARPDRPHTDICMPDAATRWEVAAMPNGGYEFNAHDPHGLPLKARWVNKPPNSRRISAQSAASLPSPALLPARDDAKWNFSTIRPDSRRHPVIASMTRSRIDVHDSYTLPAPTQPPTPTAHAPPSPALTPPSIDSPAFLGPDRAPIPTDEALRRFVLVSGIWVSSLHEHYDHAASPLCAAFNHSGTLRPAVARTVSMSFLDSPRSASPASSDNEKSIPKLLRRNTLSDNEKSIPKLLRRNASSDNEKSIPKLLRRNTSQRLHRHASFTDPPASPMSATTASSTPASKTRPRRANSTGTHSLYSMTGSLKKRYGILSHVDTLSETDEDKENRRSADFARLTNPATQPPQPPVLVIPTPTVIRPSTDGPSSPTLLPSPQLPESDRARKTQSAFNPITTVGMWDSGVTDGPGLKRRPTSMFVMNERKKKEEKKRARSDGRDRSRSNEHRTHRDANHCTGMRRKLKDGLKGLFGRTLDRGRQ